MPLLLPAMESPLRQSSSSSMSVTSISIWIIAFKCCLQFDDPKTVFSGSFTSPEITKFFLTEAIPLVFDFNDDSAQKIFGGEIKKHLLLFTKKAGSYHLSK